MKYVLHALNIIYKLLQKSIYRSGILLTFPKIHEFFRFFNIYWLGNSAADVEMDFLFSGGETRANMP